MVSLTSMACTYGEINLVYSQCVRSWSWVLTIVFLLTSCSNNNYYAPVRDATSSNNHSFSSLIVSVPTTTDGVHVVAPGESLYSIAWRYQRDFRELAALNHISEPYVIQPGQTIYLKSSPDTVQTSPVVVAQEFVPTTTKTQEPATNPSIVAAAEPEPPTAPATQTSTPITHSLVETTSAPKETTPTLVLATSPDAKKSKWIWPAQGKVMRGFSHKNKGLDIKGKEGDPVYATAGGEVVYSGTGLRGYGQLVIIKHNTEFLSAYAHNNRIVVTEGQQVTQGQQIAEIGDTGTNTEKLHFELRHKGKPVDPMKYLPSR